MRQRIRQGLHWFALQGVIGRLAAYGATHGDAQGRLIADLAVRADPGVFADELRQHGPLVRGRAAWLTGDHAIAHQLLRSDGFAVTSLGETLPKPLAWIERRTAVSDRLHPLLPPSLLSVEPPEHTRYRRTVSSVFTPRAVAALRERVEAAAVDLIDGLAAVDGTSPVDIVEQYCSQLPVTVIGDIIGVPDSDRPRILEFGELAAPSLDIGLSWRQYQRVERGLDGFNEWLATHIAKLRRHPGEDLMSQLIDAGDGGARMNDAELRATAGLVLAAGFETTVNLLGSGIRILLEHPDQLAKLLEQPDLWPGAVEEILRLESPVQLSARVASSDTEVAGETVRRGELVILFLAGANRDPAVFADPHRFDITRQNAGRHLSFSGGRHFCLGAALARAEGEVGLFRAVSARPARRCGEPPRYPRAPRLGVPADRARRGALGGTFVAVDFRAALIEETRSFGKVYRGADPASAVPTCPGWTMQQLFKHLGRGTRWSAQIIADRRQDPLDPKEVRDGRPPEDRDAAIDWLNSGAQLILDAVDQVGSDARVWTFTGPKPAGWWVRRRVHEAAVHRADAVLALGGDFEQAPELSADGVSEWIGLNIAGADRHNAPLPRGQTLHLHATDESLGPTGEWTIGHDEDGMNWSHDHAKGDAAVRGRAVDLLLAITRRRSTAEAGLEVFGDPAVWDGWLERTPF